MLGHGRLRNLHFWVGSHLVAYSSPPPKTQPTNTQILKGQMIMKNLNQKGQLLFG